ncbi:MAG: YggT family protein [Brevinematales bacterium]|jgi:uncharacterized protein YggT (Ycf19 family)|nr:YggT family protein [Brevinematales bacterium]
MQFWIMLLDFLGFALQCYSWIFIAYILLNWFPISRDNPIVKFITGLIEPVYLGILKILPPLRIGMFDLSPFYLLIIINVLSFVLERIRNSIAGG